MENNIFLKDLHIGRIIKETANRIQVSSSKIAETILRYQKNANKIYGLEDMHVDDIVQISYLLKFNILEALSKEYLSHLPSIKNQSRQENF
jgi:hypothetical protein